MDQDRLGRGGVGDVDVGSAHRVQHCIDARRQLRIAGPGMHVDQARVRDQGQGRVGAGGKVLAGADRLVEPPRRRDQTRLLRKVGVLS